MWIEPWTAKDGTVLRRERAEYELARLYDKGELVGIALRPKDQNDQLACFAGTFALMFTVKDGVDTATADKAATAFQNIIDGFEIIYDRPRPPDGSRYPLSVVKAA